MKLCLYNFFFPFSLKLNKKQKWNQIPHIPFTTFFLKRDQKQGEIQEYFLITQINLGQHKEIFQFSLYVELPNKDWCILNRVRKR